MDSNISRLLLNREWGIRTTINPDLKQKMMLIWEERSRRVLNPSKNVPIYSMDFCKMPSKFMILIVSDGEGGVGLSDTHTMSKLAYHYSCSVYSVNWSIPRPNLFGTGCSDQSVSIWDAHHFQKISTLTGHSKTVKKVKFHTTNTNLVVSGGRNGRILFWDLRCKSPVNKIITAHHGMNYSDSPFIYDKKRKCNKKTSPHPTSVTDLVFIDDFTLLSCGATDGYIKFWDIRKTYKYLDKYEPVRYLEHSKVNCRGFSSMVWDGNRSLYASSALDNIFKFDLVDTELKDPSSEADRWGERFICSSHIQQEVEGREHIEALMRDLEAKKLSLEGQKIRFLDEKRAFKAEKLLFLEEKLAFEAQKLEFLDEKRAYEEEVKRAKVLFEKESQEKLKIGSENEMLSSARKPLSLLHIQNKKDPKVCGKDNLLEKDGVLLDYGGKEDADGVSNANPGFVFSGPTNPLEVDLILMNVMKFLEPVDLQRCRLVNKYFHHFASKQLSKSHSYVYIDNSSVEHFAKLMENTMRFPYSNFSLEEECSSLMKVCLNSFGSHIKILSIFVSSEQISPNIINFENVSTILSSMPNLENLFLSGLNYPEKLTEGLLPHPPLPRLTHLDIYENEILDSSCVKSATILLSRLFAATPSLTFLTFSSYYLELNEHFIPSLISVSSLTDLYFFGFIANDFREEVASLSLMAGASFRLKKLDIQPCYWNGEGMSKFLRSQAQSLEVLKISVYLDAKDEDDDIIYHTYVFPKLLRLRHLEIKEFYDIPIGRSPIENTEFPALETLILYDSNLKDFASSPIPSLTKLEVNSFNGKRSRASNLEFSNSLNDLIVSGLRVPFPNLISLRLITPEEKVIQSTLSSCPFLQELSISGGSKNEHGEFNFERSLTGMTDNGWFGDEIRDLSSKNKIIDSYILELLRKATGRKKEERLSNLKCLKRLKIGNSDSSSSLIGDLTGYLALLEIHKLDYLYISSGKFSEGCIKALKSYHNHVVIETNTLV